MRMRTRNDWIGLFCLAFLATLATATPATSAKRFMTPGFRTTDSRPTTLVVLPPHAEFIKSKTVMTEEMVEECKRLELAAADQIRSLLSGKGYVVRVLTRQEIDADPDLRELLLRVNGRYDEEWAKIIRKPRKVHSGRYQAGEEAQQIAAQLEVDGIIIPRIQAVGVTGGRKALTFLLSFGNAMAQGYARLDLSVVDGKTGQVEAYFFGVKPAGLKALTNNPEKIMSKVTRGMFRRFPAVAKVLPPRNTRHSAGEEEKDEGSEADEDAILADLEALLGPEEEKGAE